MHLETIKTNKAKLVTVVITEVKTKYKKPKYKRTAKTGDRYFNW